MANTINKVLSTSETGLSFLQRALIIVTALALSFLMVAEVILRYWLEMPFLGIEETSVLLGLWLYFLGAAYTTRQGSHIKGGIAALVLKNQKTLGAVRFGGSLLCTVAGVVFCYYATSYGMYIFSVHRESTYLSWPTIFWVSSMLAGFVLMTLYFLIEAMRRYRELRQL